MAVVSRDPIMSRDPIGPSSIVVIIRFRSQSNKGVTKVKQPRQEPCPRGSLLAPLSWLHNTFACIR